MLPVRRDTARGIMVAGFISPNVGPPGNANLPIGALRNANREIGVPRIQPTRFVPRVPRSLSAAPAKGTPISSICSRYDLLVLIPLTPSYYCPSRTPPPYCLLWLGTQLS